jgi:hypothetical protein
MESKKLELIQKMEEKGMTVDTLAQAIEFSPMVLGLYMVKDAYPVPTRILKKVEQALAA